MAIFNSYVKLPEGTIIAYVLSDSACPGFIRFSWQIMADLMHDFFLRLKRCTECVVTAVVTHADSSKHDICSQSVPCGLSLCCFQLFSSRLHSLPGQSEACPCSQRLWSGCTPLPWHRSCPRSTAGMLAAWKQQRVGIGLFSLLGWAWNSVSLMKISKDVLDRQLQHAWFNAEMNCGRVCRAVAICPRCFAIDWQLIISASCGSPVWQWDPADIPLQPPAMARNDYIMLESLLKILQLTFSTVTFLLTGLIIAVVEGL